MTSNPFTLKPENVRAYLLGCGLIQAREEIRTQELGGGVSNVVLMIERASNPDRRWVVKQSLGKLRVKDKWLSDRERILREAEAIECLQNILGASLLPQIIHVDREACLYVMTAAPAGSCTWKELLMKGEVDLAVARRAGDVLAKLMAAAELQPQLRERFSDQTVFQQLRVDPYYCTTALRHEDLREAFSQLIADSGKIRTAIVHGDYSPKNMLVKDGHICLIDFEVVHWGDPAFDAGFLLNHLFLKAFRQPRFAGLYAQAARAFWQSVLARADRAAVKNFERMTMRHLGALMLARIDGKSPVEYICEDHTKQSVRNLGRRILLERTERLDQALQMAFC
ncbi:MAG: phosphotransferase family protein [Terriglobia bacterium]